MISHFQNSDFSLALAQVVDDASFGGAQTGECFGAARAIRDGDCESWYLEWIALAERVRRDAIQDLAAGRQSEARNAFLRAARYYQAAGHFLGRNPGDARITTTAGASTYCFATAMRLSASACITRDVDLGGIHHTAYLHQVSHDTQPLPTLLVVAEAGTAPLDAYLACAIAAHSRGWNCLTISCDANQASGATRALLAEALRCPSVDPSCLALVRFCAAPRLPLGTGDCRSALPQAIGNADQLNAALAFQTTKNTLPVDSITDQLPPGALARFHQRLLCWLDGG